jgi:hypothetical protein
MPLGFRKRSFLMVLHPERMEIIQPRVARNELPWVRRPKVRYPKGVVSRGTFLHTMPCRLKRYEIEFDKRYEWARYNPFRVDERVDVSLNGLVAPCILVVVVVVVLVIVCSNPARGPEPGRSHFARLFNSRARAWGFRPRPTPSETLMNLPANQLAIREASAHISY